MFVGLLKAKLQGAPIGSIGIFIFRQQKNCMTKKISSFRNLKVAALLCAAKAAIPCGIAASKLEYRL